MKHKLYLSNMFATKGAHSTSWRVGGPGATGLERCGLIVQMVLISVLSELQRAVFL